MFRHIQRALFGAVTARRALPAVTASFRAKRHNVHLCPEMQERVDLLLRRVARQFTLTYDVQGLRDAGVDVLLRLSVGGDQPSFIGIQIKSDFEVRPEIYRTLKSQYTDALNEYRDSLLDYYVVLCWDQTTRATEIRNVEQGMHGLKNVHVIEPTFAWNFLYELAPT